jgi:hypothetical protein
MSEQEKVMLKAVEEYAWDRHSTITRKDVESWNLDEEEWKRLEFDGNGYLLVGIEDVKVVGHSNDTWYVQATLDTGLGEETPDVYSAYQGEDGEWIVEWDHS